MSAPETGPESAPDSVVAAAGEPREPLESWLAVRLFRLRTAAGRERWAHELLARCQTPNLARYEAYRAFMRDSANGVASIVAIADCREPQAAIEYHSAGWTPIGIERMVRYAIHHALTGESLLQRPDPPPATNSEPAA